MAVIAMSMRDDHAVEASDLCREQLLAEIGTAIDKHALTSAFDED